MLLEYVTKEIDCATNTDGFAGKLAQLAKEEFGAVRELRVDMGLHRKPKITVVVIEGLERVIE